MFKSIEDMTKEEWIEDCNKRHNEWLDEFNRREKKRKRFDIFVQIYMCIISIAATVLWLAK